MQGPSDSTTELPPKETLIAEPGGPLPRLAFSLAEVTQILGLGRSSVDKLIREGRLHVMDTGLSKPRISLSELERFCSSTADAGSVAS
jgi:excisionase family DNA binding protein